MAKVQGILQRNKKNLEFYRTKQNSKKAVILMLENEIADLTNVLHYLDAIEIKPHWEIIELGVLALTNKDPNIGGVLIPLAFNDRNRKDFFAQLNPIEICRPN